MKIPYENELSLIVESDEFYEPVISPLLRERINERYEIWKYDGRRLPPLSIENYSYNAIPKCFGLLNEISLAESGITRLQNLSPLNLEGVGTLIAIIDTGIAYTDPAFLDDLGESRILYMWDQSDEENASGNLLTEEERLMVGGRIPEGFSYGREYNQEEIYRLLQIKQTEDKLLPGWDQEGHGTAIASIAAGSKDSTNGFTGAAPESNLLVVKLRPANQLLKDFYFIPEERLCYAESDIMAALSYVEEKARLLNRPMVILLALGSNNGSHLGSSPLCEYLNVLAQRQQRAAVVAVGNEGEKRHHFMGIIQKVLTPFSAEVEVERDMKGAYLELWGLAPDRFSVMVKSPTGEFNPKAGPQFGDSGKYRFVYEETVLEIDFREDGRNRRDQLIFFRFQNLKKGIWTILIYPRNVDQGIFHMWLPMEGMLGGNCTFLSPNPDTTLTTPSDAHVVMSVGAYQATNQSLLLSSGRGYDSDGWIKPEFAATGNQIWAKGLRGQLVTLSGSSAAAGLTAGAAALIMEWAVVRRNNPGINSVDVQNLFIRGARRNPQVSYPNTGWGYGALDAYQAFESIRF